MQHGINLGIDQTLLEIYRCAQTASTENFLINTLEIIRQRIPFRSALWGGVALDHQNQPLFLDKLNRNREVFVYDAMQTHFECYERLDKDDAKLWSLIPSLIKEKVSNSAQDHIRQLDGSAKNYCFHQLPTVSGNVDKKQCKHVAFGAVFLPELGQKNWLWLGRNTARQEFSSDEQTYLERLMPHLFEAMHINFKLMSLQKDLGYAVTTLSGQYIQSNVLFLDLLKQAFGVVSRCELPQQLLQKFSISPFEYVGNDVEIKIRECYGLLYCTAQKRQVRLTTLVLTGREQDVALLISSGLSYKEIAKKLEISPITVRNHVSSVYRKFGVSNAQSLCSKFYAYDLRSV
jgi:DNA-binding CsgD family transcriptional regulator